MRLTASAFLLAAVLTAHGSAPNPALTPSVSSIPTVTVDGYQAVAGRLMIRLKSEALASTRADRAELDAVPALASFGQDRGLRSSRPLIQHDLDAVAREAGLDRDVLVDLAPGTDLKLEQAAWAARPEVEWAEFDYIERIMVTPNDQYFNGQWGLRNLGTGGYTNDCDIDAELAWDVFTGSNSITIAIIDTGVRLTHQDLSAKIVAGYDFVNNDATPSDDHMHGTACASLAAASTNNSSGMAGVDWNARIMPMKGLNAAGEGTDSAIIQCMDWARSHGADVISMSLGGGSYNSSFNTAVNAAYSAGIPVVCAAGNENSGTLSYPARYTNSFAVGALSPCNQRKSPSSCDGESWWGSNYGTGLDVLSPGVLLRSATNTSNTSYISDMNGTSGATPQVAGVAALMKGLNANLSAQQIYDMIDDTADDLGSAGWDTQTGWGRMNAHQAVLAASGNSCASDLVSPVIVHAALGNTNNNSTPYPVTATVTDNCTVSSVTLRHQVGGGSWTSQLMTLVSGTYNGTIPPQAFGSVVNYQIVALDQNSNLASVSHTFVVVNPCDLDFDAPSAALLAPVGDLGSDSAPIDVQVSASDPCGILEVQVGYQLDGGGMLFENASHVGGDLFACQLPAQPYGTSVALTVYVYDASVNQNEAVLTRTVQVVDPCGSDAGAPLVELLAPFPATLQAGVAAQAQVSAGDPCDLQTVVLACSLDGGPTQPGTALLEAPGQYLLELPAQAAAGTLAWTLLVTDDSPQHNLTQLTGSLTVLPAPELPTPQVNIALQGGGQVQLSWPAVPEATGYFVYSASLVGGPWTLLLDTPALSLALPVATDERRLFQVVAHN
ncbi:MAG: S8 family serine peptidase [Candidatus Delongbacteria bacterium]